MSDDCQVCHNKLTPAQLARARKMARSDYEIRNMLRAYEAGTISVDGFGLLLEELQETQIEL